MGHMKDFDIRIRNGGDDAIAAVSEYVAALRITAAERQAIEVACEDLRHQEEVATLRGLLQRMDCAQSPRWIPVSERLPEDETPVLVYCIPRDDDGTPSCAGCDGHGGIISTAWYERLGDGDGEHWVSDGPALPLFWMPLPEPPEVTP